MDRLNRALKLAVMGSLFALGGCANNMAEQPVAGEKALDEFAEAKVVSDKPEPSFDGLKLLATDLAKAFAEDKAAATSKYGAKRVQLTGQIDAVPGQGGWDDRLTLTGYRREGEFSLDVECRLTPGQFAKVKDLSVTQRVTLTGEVNGYFAMVIVSDCEVKDIGADPAVEVTATELSQAYLANVAVAEAKYDGKPVKVNGKITAFNERELEIHLRGCETPNGGPVLIALRMGAEFSEVKDKLSVGDAIVAKGVVSTFLDGKLELTHAHLLAEK